MRFFHAVMDCCGILGIQGVGHCSTLEIFWRDILQIVNSHHMLYDRNREQRARCVQYLQGFQILGAFVQINTSSIQFGAEATVKQIGFIASGSNKNANSGNIDTVWLMKSTDFWGQFQSYVHSKSNYELYPELFPEEKPKEVLAEPVKTPKLKMTFYQSNNHPPQSLPPQHYTGRLCPNQAG
jgi:hypothetical protein